MSKPERKSLRRALAEGFDGRVVVVLLTTTLVLVFLEYFAIRPAFYDETMVPRSRKTIRILAPWALLSFGAYFVIPALITTLVLKERLSDFGLTIRGFIRHLPLYLGLFLLCVPILWAATRLFPEFLHTYPFASDARNGLKELLLWEAIYGLQFLGLEFFFRGFVIFGLEKRFGMNAVLVMVVPYCMLHFHKPLPESLAAILGGALLGIIALRTRCVLGGVLIHFGIAATMDVLVILHTGGFR